jgi:hypothetical protein
LSKNPKGRELLCRLEENIKVGPREIRWKGMNWMHLAQDTYQWRVLVNTVMNPWVPKKKKNGEFLYQLSDYKIFRYVLHFDVTYFLSE